jgi:hypothetical protein
MSLSLSHERVTNALDLTWQPVVKVWLHSTGDASSLAALLLAQIFPMWAIPLTEVIAE